MINIGLLGFGTVGQGVYSILDERRKDLMEMGLDLNIKKILVRDLDKPRDIKVPIEKLTVDKDDLLLDKDIQILVEVTGDVDLSYEMICQAFKMRKHVVTANKALVSAYFEELSQKAEDNGVYFLYEASVGGGIPVIKALKDQIRLNKVRKIQGILNGTCNYMLTRMTLEGLTYEEALKEAQHLGYAESDPSSDVKGLDAMRKLRILSTMAFGSTIKEEQIICHGIDRISATDISLLKERGRIIKLMSEGKEVEGGYQAMVEPKAVLKDSYLARVSFAENCVTMEGNHAKGLKFQGPGAGMYPTANAVLTDVIDCELYTQSKANPLRKRVMGNKNQDIHGRYYVRMFKDGKHDVKIADFIQEMIQDSEEILAFETKEVRRLDLLKALSKLNEEAYILIALEG